MKKQLMLSVAGAALILSILTGCTSSPIDSNPTDPNPSETANSSSIIGVETTYQYLEAFTYLGYNLPEGTEKASREQVLLAGWTAREYVYAALEDPYLIAGYWKKDNYLSSGVEKITVNLSGTAKEEFLNNNTILKESPLSSEGVSSTSALSQIMFMPTINEELTLDSTCYDTWELGSCRKDEVAISNVSASDGEKDGSVIIRLEAKATPLFNDYQGVIIEPRIYQYEFTLEETNPPASADTKVPIYTITSINGSLVINPTEKLF
jgi:hypothetical protein